MRCKVIYHEECGCLFADNIRSDECRKRYYTVRDLENQDTKQIVICNEYIRLMLNEYQIGKRFVGYNTRQYKVERIIEEIIGEYVNIGNAVYSRGNDLTDVSINFVVCERPWICRTINLVPALEMIREGNFMIYEETFNAIKNYLERTTYKKYKTKYADTMRLLRKAQSFIGSKQREIVINSMFNNILQMQIKDKV